MPDDIGAYTSTTLYTLPGFLRVNPVSGVESQVLSLCLLFMIATSLPSPALNNPKLD